MKCIGIIWNCAWQFRYEILKLISEYAVVESHYTLDLHEKYEEFVRSIYSLDTIAKWKVDSKVEHMSSTECTCVCIVHFDIDTSETYFHEKKKHFVFTNLQNMKDSVRSTFSSRVKNYFFDIIFHCSESDKEFSDNLDMIESYSHSS